MFIPVFHLKGFSLQKKLLMQASIRARGVVRRTVIIKVCKASELVGFSDVVLSAIIPAPIFCERSHVSVC